MANFTEAELDDFVFYQVNEIENLNSYSDDDLDEDLVFEIDKNDIVKKLKFTEKTEENFGILR
jgi:hypothetical protein